MIFSAADANVPQFSGAWEVLSVFVERDGHNPVCGIEGFLDTVSMMDVNVDVEHSLVKAEELDDAENDVCVGLAERRNKAGGAVGLPLI